MRKPYITDLDLFLCSHVFVFPSQILNEKIDSLNEDVIKNNLCVFTFSDSKKKLFFYYTETK